jgi:hypothetical protein
MITLLVAMVVPIVVYVLSRRYIGYSGRYHWILITACLLFPIGSHLPSPLVHGQQTQYLTHLVGGGLFTGFLWLYIMLVRNFRLSMFWEVVSLFALVCTLGVANELFEVVLFWSGHMSNGISDTSWDLVANTTGAIIFYLGYKGIEWLRLAWTK